MMVLGMLAWFAAAVSLWLGARRYQSAVARGYRWLAAGAALYCSGLVVQGILGGTLNPAPGLSFTDLPPLLALAAVGIGIAVLTMAEREVTPQEGSAGSVLPGLADGYVMAVALLVNGRARSFSRSSTRWPTWPCSARCCPWSPRPGGGSRYLTCPCSPSPSATRWPWASGCSAATWASSAS
jgi:hypothetical protein